MEEFKYIKIEENKYSGHKYIQGSVDNDIVLAEIAYQLKRIADILETKGVSIKK